MNQSNEKPELRIFDDRSTMGAQAALAVSQAISSYLNRQEEVNMIFAAAPSQNEFLEELKKKDLPWNRINAFHMDEYVGLPEDAPQGFGNFLKERLFDHLPFRSVNYLKGNADDLSAECNRYAELLTTYPVDIVCMGIGENCHIAFNDPHVADFNDKELVKIVDLDLACRTQQVNDGCFSEIGAVPTHAITLTIPALVSAERIFCMVPGPTKATAVYHTMRSEINEQYPSTILRTHPNCVLFADKESSAQLAEVGFVILKPHE